VLTSGISDQDRRDFEEIYEYMNRFLDDIDDLKRISTNRRRVEEVYAELSERYGHMENEIDLMPILERIYEKMVCQLDMQKDEWTSLHLSIDLQTADEYKIIGWEREVAALPAYLDDATVSKVAQMQRMADIALSARRVKQIILLFSELNEEEKAMVRRELL